MELHIKEHMLEEFVYSEADKHGICIVDRDHWDLYLRQVNLLNYGVADIIKFRFGEDFIDVCVLELKVEPLKTGMLNQVSRYMKAVSRLIEPYAGDLQINVIGQLAGPLDNTNDFVFILDNIINIDVFDVRVDMYTGFITKPVDKNWHKPRVVNRWLKRSMKTVLEAYKRGSHGSDT